ncbi:hypothetical protein SAMN05216188_11663 [Lentzea xinjiangensis]|uniref:Uncharacterized protein n=1 Tax=Lentzea xinjiangensis TaxID=402600 RepID=A0A1H9SEA4_9PSEU|nr:hypothetical protein [Lentzea xinjiangensis]SER83376.1 hypothetical protein SAMN05216188_11663 [Lentzea xinjiangensis]
MSIDLDRLRTDFTSTHLDEADREEALRLLLRERREGDADLLRHLLAEETATHREGWGVSESLALAALLLAECGREEDVWTLWEAKNASFDTMAGLDGFLLFPAGIAGTTAHVIASEEHPERDDLMAYMSEYLGYEKLTDDDIREHIAGLRSHFED